MYSGYVALKYIILEEIILLQVILYAVLSPREISSLKLKHRRLELFQSCGTIETDHPVVESGNAEEYRETPPRRKL